MQQTTFSNLEFKNLAGESLNSPTRQPSIRNALVDDILGSANRSSVVVRIGPKAFGPFASKADVTVEKNDGFITIDWNRRILVGFGIIGENYKLRFDRAGTLIELNGEIARGLDFQGLKATVILYKRATATVQLPSQNSEKAKKDDKEFFDITEKLFSSLRSVERKR